MHRRSERCKHFHITFNLFRTIAVRAANKRVPKKGKKLKKKIFEIKIKCHVQIRLHTMNWHKINYGQKLCAESYLILRRKLIRIYFKEK